MKAASISQSKLLVFHPRMLREWVALSFCYLTALVLRLWMLRKFFEVNGDALIYGGLAKNLLLNGHYALNGTANELYPTLIRLPGYPFFLAACFRIFGMENYASAAWAEIALDLVGLLLVADTAIRLAPEPLKRRAGWAAFALAAFCPFTAIFSASPLTESPSLFALVVALNLAVRFHAAPRWATALGFSMAVSAAALLRPDGALVGVALLPVVLLGLRRLLSLRRAIAMAGASLLLALLPFGLWAWRNWQVFGVFEPLAPRLAIDPGEDPHLGWERWTKSWCLDFVSTYQIYWNVPDGKLDLSQLPARAFDSPAQRAETEAVVALYDQSDQKLTPEVDAAFDRIAAARAAEHPLRTHLWLPLGRVVDMLFRPRVEDLPIDLDWWNYHRHRVETRFAWFYVLLNAGFFFAAAGAVWKLRPKFWWAMVLFFALRCGLLATVEAPEARYTIEFFPMLFVLAGIFLARYLPGGKEPEKL